MALPEATQSDIVYDPVCLDSNGSLFDRIDLEEILDSDDNNRPGYNPETGWPFNMYDIQPQPEIRMQMRQRVLVGDEYFVGQNMLLRWSVIQDYPFEILDESHMSEYVNSLAHWIANDISLPRDLEILWKSLNLLRLNCHYSDANKRLFRSVNGFVTVIETLISYFDIQGLRAWGHREHRNTVNICREILKLAEITDFCEHDGDFILGTRSRAHSFFGIMRTVFYAGRTYSVGKCKKDVRRIVRIMEVTCNHPQIHHIMTDIFFGTLIYDMLEDPTTPSVDLIRCVDIAYAYSCQRFDHWAARTLCLAMQVLIDRFYFDSGETNTNSHPHRWVRVDEEYSDRSAALEKVLKTLCQLCARYGANVVRVILLPRYYNWISYSNLILNYALLHPEEGEASFSGKHLLYSMIINKYIFESTRAERVGVSDDDIKIVFDFALSSLPGRYLFNGRPRLKELTDQVINTMLDFPECQSLLQNWTRECPHYP